MQDKKDVEITAAINTKKSLEGEYMTVQSLSNKITRDAGGKATVFCQMQMLIFAKNAKPTENGHALRQKLQLPFQASCISFCNIFLSRINGPKGINAATTASAVLPAGHSCSIFN